MHYERMVKLTDRYVGTLLPKQVLDPSDADCGGFRDPVTLYTDTRPSAYALIYLLTSYLNPDSEYGLSADFLRRIQAGMRFLLRRQHEDGTIDLSVWRHAPCEVGFTLSALCKHYERFERFAMTKEHEELRAQLKTFILRGAKAVRDGVLYTPNHRWAAGIAPLASVASLFGDDGYLAKAIDFLEDGIDQNEDGSYFYENSPNYNTVANKGLLLAARFMEAESGMLLAAVRSNLEFVLHTIQPGGEAETAFSRRQDRGRANSPFGGYSVFKEMAVIDRNGQYAKAADLLLDGLETNRGMPGDFYPDLLLLEDRRFRDENIPRIGLPSDYLRHYRSTGIVRRRNGDFVGTLMYDLPSEETVPERGGRLAGANLLTVRHGQAVIDGLYVKFAYQEAQSFKPDRVVEIGEGVYRLEQHYTGWPLHLRHRREGLRQEWMKADLKIAVIVKLQPQGAEVTVEAVEGERGVPVAVEWLIRPGAHIVSERNRQPARSDEVIWFSEPSVCIRSADSGEGLEIDGGEVAHRLPIGYYKVVTGHAEKSCSRLTATGYTPYSRTFRIRAVHTTGSK